MTCLPEDLITLMQATAAIKALVDTRCHYNHIPESAAKPHIWFRVASDTEERTLDGVGGLHEAVLDLECAGLTESSAQSVADAVKTAFDGYKGAVGNETAQAIFLRDKDDDYIPFSNLSDEGVHVVAFTVNMWYTT